jgi:hypothetical protein
MADDFKITAKCMGESSVILHQAGKFYNACYLAGYVIECYSKILVGLLGSSPRQYSHNTAAALSDVETRYLMNNSSITMQLTRSGVMTDPRTLFMRVLADWNPNERYSNSHPWDVNASNQYQMEIAIALQYIAQLEVAGII